MKTNGAGYGWHQLCQWDMPGNDEYVVTTIVKSALSESYCRFVLVNRIDQGGGYLRCERVKKQDVTQDILNEAGPLIGGVDERP